MKYFLHLFFLSVTILLTGCDNPVTEDISSNQQDWEGNYPSVNEGYQDSIVFTSYRYAGTSFAPSVHIANQNGNGIRALTTQWFTSFPSWSPRRWKVLYIVDTSFNYNKPARSLFMMNADGSNPKRITPRGEQVFGKSAWSPNGSTVAYIEIDTTFQWLRGRVKLINPDGTNPRTLTGWYLQLTCLSWSNDSKIIYFGGAGSDGRDRIYRMNSDGSGITPLFYSDYGCYFPSVSPDGKLLSFSSFALIDSTHFSKIFTYSLNTGQINQVTIDKTFDYNPTWSPDSKYIVYSCTPIGGSNSALQKIKLDDGSVTEVTDDTSAVSQKFSCICFCS